MGRAAAEAEMATLSLPGPETRESLVTYERMVEREIYQALRQLERAQRRRKGEFVPPAISIGHKGVQKWRKRETNPKTPLKTMG